MSSDWSRVAAGGVRGCRAAAAAARPAAGGGPEGGGRRRPGGGGDAAVAGGLEGATRRRRAARTSPRQLGDVTHRQRTWTHTGEAHREESSEVYNLSSVEIYTGILKDRVAVISTYWKEPNKFLPGFGGFQASVLDQVGAHW